MIYFKFKEVKNKKKSEKESFVSVIINFIFSSFIANPDYEKKINDVYEWLIEYNEDTNYVEREIGLDDDFNSIMKMPFKKNYGYWVDSNLTIEDFNRIFLIEIIKENEFLKKWDELQ